MSQSQQEEKKGKGIHMIIEDKDTMIIITWIPMEG